MAEDLAGDGALIVVSIIINLIRLTQILNTRLKRIMIFFRYVKVDMAVGLDGVVVMIMDMVAGVATTLL